MKKSIILLLLIIACDLPSEPVGIKVVYEYHEETEDVCRGLDVLNGVLVAGASSNGYFRYNILNEDANPTLDLAVHISDINPNVGDDAVFDVLISDNVSIGEHDGDMAIILDDVDNILIESFDTDDIDGNIDNDLITQNPCGNSLLYRSIAINDDILDSTILFTLQKHFDVLPPGYDAYSTSIGIREYYNEVTTWEDPADNLPPYTTETFLSNPGCITLTNPNIEAMKFFYADNYLSLAKGPYVQIYKFLHNVLLTETYVESHGDATAWGYLEEFTDLNDNTFWDNDSCGYIDLNPCDDTTQDECDDYIPECDEDEEYLCPSDDEYDASASDSNWVQEEEPFTDCGSEFVLNDINQNGIQDDGETFTTELDLENCEDADIQQFNGICDSEYFVDHNDDGICCGEYIGDNLEYSGRFYVQGGEASSLYSIGNIVIGGFNNYRGCYMALLDSDGVESNNLTFADGYSINAISYDETSQILALSAGDDGVIIYSWNGYLSVSLRGIIDTGEHNKVYDVKVVGDNIYVGSENGISIYKIEG